MLDLNSHDKIIAKIQFFNTCIVHILRKFEELEEEQELEDIEDVLDDIYLLHEKLFHDILYLG